MEWKDGLTVYFITGRAFSRSAVYRAVVGKIDTGATSYLFVHHERKAYAVHGAERVTDPTERDRARKDFPDMPDAVFVNQYTWKKINARRNGNIDCDRKGCLDRYDCLWYDAGKEREKWNKIPKNHVPGEERCQRFVDKNGDLRLKKHSRKPYEETEWSKWKKRKDGEWEDYIAEIWPSLLPDDW